MELKRYTDPSVITETGERAKKSRKSTQFLAAIIASCGNFCAGSTLGWTSPTIPQFTNSNDVNSFDLNETEVGAIGGILFIGAALSSIPSGYLADKIGRKLTLILLGIVFLIQWIIIVVAPNSIVLIVARFIGGTAVGAVTVTVPMYVGEIADPTIRGTLGSFAQLCLACGIVTSYVVGTFTPWTTLSTVLGVISIIYTLLCLLLPESPYYLIKVKRRSEAESSMRKLRGENYDIRGAIEKIEYEIEESNKKSVKFHEILKSKANRKALFCTITILAIQQCGGINAVTFYAVPIFQNSGSSLSPEIVGILVGVLELTGSALSTVIIEKATRRFYLILSSIGMSTSSIILGVYFNLQYNNVDIDAIRFLPAVIVLIFMASYGLGYGPVPYLLIGEMFSPEVRGACAGVAVLVCWFSGFLVTFLFPIIQAILGAHIMFYIFACIMWCAIVFVYFVLPETKGKSLAEIQEILAK